MWNVDRNNGIELRNEMLLMCSKIDVTGMSQRVDQDITIVNTVSNHQELRCTRWHAMHHLVSVDNGSTWCAWNFVTAVWRQEKVQSAFQVLLAVHSHVHNLWMGQNKTSYSGKG